ncbi:MAG: DUF5692 family protein [Paludibacter sp.]|nr:DUF5692 family protein [Paludibacter sp.]
MFFFESIPWYSALMWCGVVAGLMLINELTRSSKWFSYVVYILVPVILTFAVWPKTAGPESSVGTWFHWVKVYSALAGVLGFMYLRHSKKGISYKWLLIFPPLILSINILEAVIRDFQVYAMYHGDLFGSVVNGVTMQGGSWNIMNGIAGIINIITISGWMGIFIGKDKKKDMLWPDQLWWWIIAYDLWNFAYVYNCVSDHSFYAGAALLVSCTIPAFFMGKGAWLQHRAQTLAIWMMFTMCFPVFVDESMFAVKSSHNPDALWTLSALALAFNIGVLVFHFYKIFKYKRNPLKVEVYIDEPKYAEIAVKK